MEKTEIKPAIQGTKYMSWTLHKSAFSDVQGVMDEWEGGGDGRR